MRRKNITSFLLGSFFVICGVAVIMDRYAHGYRADHFNSIGEERAVMKGIFLIAGGAVGIFAGIIGSGPKKS